MSVPCLVVQGIRDGADLWSWFNGTRGEQWALTSEMLLTHASSRTRADRQRGAARGGDPRTLNPMSDRGRRARCSLNPTAVSVEPREALQLRDFMRSTSRSMSTFVGGRAKRGIT